MSPNSKKKPQEIREMLLALEASKIEIQSSKLELQASALEIDSKNQELESLNLSFAFEQDLDVKNRVIRIDSELDENAFSCFDAALTALENINKRGITVRICSYGGDMYNALGIVGRIRSSKCKITTEGYGAMMSGASLILASGHKRKMSYLSELMHHEPSYDSSGRKSEIEAETAQLKRTWDMWCNALEEFTKTPSSFWLEKGVHTDSYFTAKQCLELGVIDSII